jgi:diguanylate cyclase (GGDEF)-like protein
MDLQNKLIDQLRTFTIQFAKTVCITLDDMTSTGYTVDENSYTVSHFSFRNVMVVYIHFYGTIQGEFLIAADETSALQCACTNVVTGTDDERNVNRFMSGNWFSEVLNICVGQTILKLEKMYDNLSYTPAIAIYGSVDFPRAKSALVEINSEDIKIRCGLSLNLVQPKIAETLHNVQQSLKHTVKLANTDALTGLYNRAFFDLNFKKHVRDAQQHKNTLCLVVVDIDHFKRFNDTYGHLIGDKVLVDIADVVDSKIRGEDFAVRYGGDELVIILTQTDIEGARLVAERICSGIKSKRIVIQLEEKEIVLEVTVSVGITLLRNDDSAESFFKRADTNLYKAKEGGRNKIVWSLE